MYKKQMLGIAISIVMLVVALAPHYLCSMQVQSAIIPCIADANSDEVIKKLVRSSKLKTKNFWDRLEEEGKNIPEYKDENEYCLGGKQYKFISRLGSGEEGEVFQIKDMSGNEFALKVYHQPGASGLKGGAFSDDQSEKITRVYQSAHRGKHDQ
jgi:hypothetical protein